MITNAFQQGKYMYDISKADTEINDGPMFELLDEAKKQKNKTQ